jgi:hypothetical protein
VIAHAAKDLEAEGDSRKRRFAAVELLALIAGAQDVKPGDEGAAEALWRKARLWQVLFKNLPTRQWFEDARIREQHDRAAFEFVRWWQEEALLRPVEGEERRILVPTLQEMKIHHHVLDRVLEARKVMLERRSAVKLPETYALPCKTCGRVFETTAPRFARTCSECQKAPAYQQRLRIHRRGAFPVFTGGFYPKGPKRRQYVWPTVCEHPECVAVFPANHPDDLYCPDHTRLSAHRARRKLATPKNQRFRFYPNYSECDEGSEVRYDFVIDGKPRTCIIGPDGYQARDEAEFRPLAYYAAVQPVLKIVPADA